jgi:hypothetical protein
MKSTLFCLLCIFTVGLFAQGKNPTIPGLPCLCPTA